MVIQKQKLWLCKKYRPKKKYTLQNATQLRQQYDQLIPLPMTMEPPQMTTTMPVAVTVYGDKWYSTKKTKKCQVLMHHKTVLFLNAKRQVIAACIGSYNFSRTAKLNKELMILIRGPQEDLDALYSEWMVLRQASQVLD